MFGEVFSGRVSVALSLIATSSMLLCATPLPTAAKQTTAAKSSEPEKSCSTSKASARTRQASSLPDESQSETIELPGHAAFTAWKDAKRKPWAAMLCVHGLSMHKETYAPLGKRLSKLGIETYAIDVRGFGSWKENEPEKDVDYDLTFKDIREGLEYLRRIHPTLPVFILGESMGGALALQSSARFPELVDGCITSVPQGTGKYTLPTEIRVLATGLLRGPNAEVNMNKVMKDRVSKKPEVVETLITSPKVRRDMKVKELVALKRLLSANHKIAHEVRTTPVLIVQGYRDRLIPANRSMKLFNEVGTLDKDLVLAGQSEHMIFEEGQFTDYMLDSLVSWIDKNSNESPITTPSEIDAKSIVRKRSRDAEFLRELRKVQNYYRLKDWAKARTGLEHALAVGSRDRAPIELRDYLASLPRTLIAPPVMDGTQVLFDQSGLSKLAAVSGDATYGAMVALFTDSSLELSARSPEVAKYFEEKNMQRANVELAIAPPKKGVHKSRAKAQAKSDSLSDDFEEKHPGVKLVKVDINTADGKKAAKQLGVFTAPTLLVFDSKRQVRHYQIGNINQSDLDANLESISAVASKDTVTQ